MPHFFSRSSWTFEVPASCFRLFAFSLTCCVAVTSSASAQAPRITESGKSVQTDESASGENKAVSASEANADERLPNFATDKLVAWCLVPFDAKKRGPAERARMLKELGLRKFAYDWRDEHIPSWDEELRELKKNGIELTAFWCSASLHPAENENNEKIFDFLKRNQVKTQLWFMLPAKELEDIEQEQQRVEVAAAAIRELAEAAKPLGCSVGLYNHGGWIGKPSSLIRVMEQLEDQDNVGIVYNFHHAHEDLDDFPQALEQLKPYLMCLNLNGMTAAGPKIQTIGDGQLDSKIIRWVQKSGYQGPIGILDHRNEMDARLSLKSNIDGLQSLLKQ